MSGRQACAARAWKHSVYRQRRRRQEADNRRQLGLRRRDVRQLRALPACGVAVVRCAGRTWRVLCWPWRVEFDAPGRPTFWRR